MNSKSQSINIDDSNFADTLFKQAKDKGLQAIQPIINKLLRSIPKKIIKGSTLSDFLLSWGKTFDSFIKQYDNLNKKRNRQIAQAVNSSVRRIIGGTNMDLFNIVKTTEQIRYLIKAMYNVIQVFEQEFNININYGIFIGPSESASGNIEVQIKDINADVLSEAASYNYYNVIDNRTNKPKLMLSSRIKLSATSQSGDNTQFKSNDDAVRSFEIPFFGSKEEVTDDEQTKGDLWLKLINQYWNDAIKHINPRVRKQRKLNQIFASYMYNRTKNGKNQEGVLGEGVIKAFLICEHLALIESKYSEYIEYCKSNNIKKGKGTEILGGPKYSKVIKALEAIMKPDKDIYFATGDFDYREVWDALKNNQVIVKDLTETSFSKISSSQMKQLYGIYKDYINQQIQIKKFNASVSGYTTINLCRMLAQNFTDNNFLNLVNNKSMEMFEEALRVSTGSSAQEFMDALRKNLT